MSVDPRTKLLPSSVARNTQGAAVQNGDAASVHPAILAIQAAADSLTGTTPTSIQAGAPYGTPVTGSTLQRAVGVGIEPTPSAPPTAGPGYLPSLADILSSGEGSYAFGGIGKPAPAPVAAPVSAPVPTGTPLSLPPASPLASLLPSDNAVPVTPFGAPGRPVNIGPSEDPTGPKPGDVVVEGPPPGIPTGPVDAYGNGVAVTNQLKAQLAQVQAAKADEEAKSNALNQQSLANSQASVSAREDKEAKWEKEVADSSILNRVNSGDSPALMAAKTALSGQRSQAFDERARNKGMLRGQELRAQEEAMRDATTRHGQNIHGEVARAGQEITARGQDITAATSRDNNTTTNAAHMEAARLQALTSTKNNAADNAARLEAAQAQGKISGLQQEITPQGTFYSWLEMNPKTKTFEFKTNKPMVADKKA